MRFSADELKAIVLHYGSYDKARKKLGIGKASLIDAANADISGRSYRLSDANATKIQKHLNRLGKPARGKIRQYEKLLDSISDHPNVKRGFMNANQADREWAMQTRNKYKRLKANILWTKIMSKFYDKYGWKKGRWTK
jgi:hypothetical protein